ncbi:RNA-binding motif protein, X-linked 2-like isoform X2 [Daphnia pulex]|uniref:RNA-binding motif protein, X-linked 2-like isoform X1 n=1 Tax=Daphnia pulex TaxID=6669 RepID=UPI001EDCD157|nr:RNA-binding motif protein, X-linked 2-like isoform X1 [Daphnia pulex]XP_046442174.1 RNA-binding motif protein, X-linked 2-like isoform X2 [Daphnia pulex]
MNPLTNVKNIKKLSETELKYNISGKASWHYQYKDSAWIFIGGLPYELSEGDIICIFSQYGEVANINLVRDKVTGKSKGFCFLCYEDQRSTILAVDNLNSIKVCGRTLRVDHVEQYKIPKDPDKLDEDALRILQEGCGPESSIIKTLVNSVQENPAASVTAAVSEGKIPKEEKDTESTSKPKHREEREKERRRSRSPDRRRSTQRKHSDDRNKFHDKDHHHYDRTKKEKERDHRRERSRDSDRRRDRR